MASLSITQESWQEEATVFIEYSVSYISNFTSASLYAIIITSTLQVSMNWTGGGLSRHSRKTGGLTARQKQHFAKVQISQRMGARKRSPQTRTILGNIVENHQRRSPSIDSVTGYKRDQVRREQSASGCPPDPILRPYTRRGSPRFSYYESEHSECSDKDPIQIKREQFGTPYDELYDATPEPPVKKRRRDAVVAQSEQNEPCISESRRQLLRKEDWVGIKVQERVLYKFVPPTYGDKFGQRRKVSHQARYKSRQTAIDPSIIIRGRRGSSHDSEVRKRHDTQGKTDVRISIGGRTLNPGISSSTAPSRRHPSSTHTQVLGSQATSSDVMLLDQEDILDDFQGADNNFDHTIRSFPERSRQRIHRYNFELDDRYQRLKRPGTSHNQFQIEGQEDVQQSRFSAESFSEEDSPYISPLESNRVYLDDGVIFSSSSVSVQHPVPQSSKPKLFLHHLRSSSSELAYSTVAQVGRTEPAVPGSQVLENEIWKTWVDELDGGDDLEAHQDQPAGKEALISPGVSEAPIQEHERKLSSKTSQLREAILKLIDDRDNTSNMPIPSSCSISVTSQAALGIHEEIKQLQIPRHLIPQASNRFTDSRLDTVYRAEAHPKPPLNEKPAQPNSDEVWRKFVFSDGENDDED